MVADYAVSGSTLTLAHTYLWGTDLSGNLHGASGVGGLLAFGTASGLIELPVFDGNGNVMGLTDRTSGQVTAAYEYSPFGDTIRKVGTYASINPVRFSSKYTDDETKLIYYGHRYYSPSLGRFIGRDQTGEKGGLHLFAFVDNCPIDLFDALGDDGTDFGSFSSIVYGENPGEFYGNNGGGSSSTGGSSLGINLGLFLGAIIGQTGSTPPASAPKNNPNYQSWLKPYQSWLNGTTKTNPPSAIGNSYTNGVQNNDCAVAAIQNEERNLGIPILSRDKIIQLLGKSTADFSDDGQGLQEPTKADITADLNKVFNTQGYSVVGESFKGAAQLAALANQAYAQQGGLLVTSYLPFSTDPNGIPFGIPSADHIMAAALVPSSPGSSGGTKLLVENTYGHGNVSLVTPTQALTNQTIFSTYSSSSNAAASGYSSQIWMVVPNPGPP